MNKDLSQEYSLEPGKNPALKEWKQRGGQAIGYFCLKVPVEIIHAAGFFPIRILGNRDKLKDMSQYLTSYSCYFVKSIFEAALQGRYAQIDGQVISYDCDCMRFLSEMWSKVIQPSYFYFLVNPHSASVEGAEEFFAHELQDFWASLQSYRGESLIQEKLFESIDLYNQLRGCFRQIEALREQSKLSATEAAKLILYGQLVPPKRAVQNLKNVLEQDFVPRTNGPRVMVVGGPHPDFEFFELVESMNARVVADDTCTFGRTAQPDVEIMDNDPFLSLSHYYIHDQSQCPYMATEGRFEQRTNDILDTIKRNQINGVIFAIQRYCDPHQLDYPDLKYALEDNGIPTLLIEFEQSVDLEPIKNRLNAFMEILENN